MEAVLFGLGALAIVTYTVTLSGPPPDDVFDPWHWLLIWASPLAMVVGMWVAGQTLLLRIWLAWTSCVALVLLTAIYDRLA
jgi:hypothetical protein